jgi:hypothetical protein
MVSDNTTEKVRQYLVVAEVVMLAYVVMLERGRTV